MSRRTNPSRMLPRTLLGLLLAAPAFPLMSCADPCEGGEPAMLSSDAYTPEMGSRPPCTGCPTHASGMKATECYPGSSDGVHEDQIVCFYGECSED